MIAGRVVIKKKQAATVLAIDTTYTSNEKNLNDIKYLWRHICIWKTNRLDCSNLHTTVDQLVGIFMELMQSPSGTKISKYNLLLLRIYITQLCEHLDCYSLLGIFFRKDNNKSLRQFLLMTHSIKYKILIQLCQPKTEVILVTHAIMCG